MTCTDIRIATYNTKNFFHAQHPQHPKKPRELRELARMVAKIDAQVIGLQEVENDASLVELNERLANPYPHGELVEGNSKRGINLGFLSRVPLTLASHRQLVLKDEAGQELHEFADAHAAQAGQSAPLLFQRDLLLAQVEIGQFTVAVFNVHLKSRIENDWSSISSDDVRLAEARAVSNIVTRYKAQNPQHLAILLGDFNQRHDHASLAPIMSMGYFDPVSTELLPNNTQLSTHWSKPRDRIDFILLCDAARQRYVKGSATVHREAGARKASDHYPVSIRLDLS